VDPDGPEVTGADADAGRADCVAGTLSEESPAAALYVRGWKVRSRFTVRRVCRREAQGDTAAARLYRCDLADMDRINGCLAVR
jgi:hypothetical protein